MKAIIARWRTERTFKKLDHLFYEMADIETFIEYLRLRESMVK
jgi:hypothetical protein